MGIRSEWMEVQMTELESALQNLWSDGLYKIILSNAIKKESEGAAYRKVVLNRKTNGWQAEQYTEKQVFHENLKADQVRPFVEQALEQAFRQCSGWDGEWEHTIRISKKGKVTGSKKRVAATQAPKAQTETTGRNIICWRKEPSFRRWWIWESLRQKARSSAPCMTNTVRSTVLWN